MSQPDYFFKVHDSIYAKHHQPVLVESIWGINMMTYKGIAKGNVVELENGVMLPEGTRVNVIPEEITAPNAQSQPSTLRKWLQAARRLRAQLPTTRDSTDLLRQIRIRKERASQ